MHKYSEVISRRPYDALEDGFTVERINKRSVRVITKGAEIELLAAKHST